MKAFMDRDFLLSTETAKTLYHNYAENMQRRTSSKFSVKNEVSSLADCPVLIVHKPEVDDIFKVI